MKLPTDIVTRHKIRDSKICSLYAKDNVSMEDIGSRFKISATRVHQIIWKNRHLIKIDKDYEKTKRLHLLNRILKNKGETTIKDAVDILKEIRTEMGDTDSVGSKDTKVIIIRETNGNQNQGRDVSRQVSVLRV